MSTALPPKMSEKASWWSKRFTDWSPVLSSGSAVPAARTVAPNTAPERPLRPASSEPDSSTSTPATAVTMAAPPKTPATRAVECCGIGCGPAPLRLPSRARPGCDSGASARPGIAFCARWTRSSPPSQATTIASVPGLTPATFALDGSCIVMIARTTTVTTSTDSRTGMSDPARKLSGRSWRTARSHAASTTVWIAMPPTRLPTARPTLPLAAAVIVMTSSGRSVASESRIRPPIAAPSPSRASSASVELESRIPASQIATAEAAKIATSQTEARPPTPSASRVRGVARHASVRAARVVAPPLVAAVGSEEVAAGRGIAEAHDVRAARSDELDGRRRDTREQLVERAGRRRRRGVPLAGTAPELGDERPRARERVETRRRAGRERRVVGRRAQHGLDVVADGAHFLEASGGRAGAHARHAPGLALRPARQVRARPQVVVVDHAAAADRVGEVHRQGLGEPEPERLLHPGGTIAGRSLTVSRFKTVRPGTAASDAIRSPLPPRDGRAPVHGAVHRRARRHDRRHRAARDAAQPPHGDGGPAVGPERVHARLRRLPRARRAARRPPRPPARLHGRHGAVHRRVARVRAEPVGPRPD